MQEHVELEVSLEIIMARIAQKIFELEKKENINNKEKEELNKLIKMQQDAYKGNRNAVLNILKNNKK